MARDIEMIGKVFGKWTVLKQGDNLYDRKAYICKCSCGVEKLVSGNELRRGKTKGCWSCAMLDTHNYNGKPYTHYREYNVYMGMKQRCYNPNTDKYDNHGGRGITVCKRWLDSFPAFMDDMGMRPSNKHSIERTDNDANYEPSNCIWATNKVQANNRRPKLSKCYSFHKSKNKYIVRVKKKHVGYADTEKEAIIKRDAYIAEHKLNLRIAL